MRSFLLSLFGLAACGTGASPADLDTALGTENACAYPEGARNKLKDGGVMPTWYWEDARHRDGRTASLEIEKIPCNSDDDIDWSPFDVLLFVSIPAW